MWTCKNLGNFSASKLSWYMVCTYTPHISVQGYLYNNYTYIIIRIVAPLYHIMHVAIVAVDVCGPF